MLCSIILAQLCITVCVIVCANSKLAPFYSSSAERVKNRYIVKLKNDVDVDVYAANIESMLRVLGMSCYVSNKYHTVIKGFVADLNLDGLKVVRELDLVVQVESDCYVYASTVNSWGLDRVDQHYLPLDDIYMVSGTGAGAHVYIIDTGILPTHDDFGGRADAVYDCAIPHNGGMDCNGHGTFCAGTAGGSLHGIAKEVAIHGVRVLNCLGIGTTSGVIDGINWVAANGMHPGVASLSLGGGYSKTLNDASNGLVSMGFTMAVATGNDGNDACMYSPASASEAISVSASDINDNFASFSNVGPCVDIVAPGVDITSTWHTSDTATNTLSGTSMACPHVAGAVAILIANDPNLTTTDVKNKIISMGTADVLHDVPVDTPNLLLYIE